ncbi:DUF3472 domain-containing protein [Paraglaciecola sp.]|uniref:DUF3472 domain-containing protein n=1 Tax=Paraglaciecola sp. TaxID=1920173 RepID=UPI0030F3A601
MINKVKFKFYCTTVLSALLISGCGGSSASAPVDIKKPIDVVIEEPVEPELTIEIAVAGNSWILDKVDESSSLIGEQGITNWTNENDELVTYVYVGRVGEINIGIKGQMLSGQASIQVSLNGKQKVVELTNTEAELIPVGVFNVDQIGYQKVIMRGIERSSDTFPQISHLVIGGAATKGDNYYVKDEFYWGRRGPSVHLTYTKPNPGENNEWFYSEIEVPVGSDALGSYFMTNGFGEGYMGIQVNSPTERRVLFSVWSPFQTDDPSSIPEEDKIQLLGKGEGVTVGEFGNEGSGGQSYYVYNWQAGLTYKLLVNITPSEEAGKTDYTGYFFSPQTNEWQLIASFRRPKITTYVTRQHSFLENFNPDAGQFERKGLYKNQWLYSETGQWHPLTQATFTYDATAAKQARRDYQGGVDNGVFYMKNTGFFSDSTSLNSVFNVTQGTQPDIDFTALPVAERQNENIAVNSTLLDNSTFVVSSLSDAQPGNELALAFDGNVETFWHTPWGDNAPGYPHDVLIDLGSAYEVNRFDYTPRPDGGNGTITGYKIYVSNSPTDFGSAAAVGSWQPNETVKSVTFSSVNGRYVKLIATSGSGTWASAAEINVGANQTILLDNSAFIVSSSSLAELVDDYNPLSYAFDNNDSTLWHTSYTGTSVEYPHEVTIDLTTNHSVVQFDYTPRTDGGINGTISDYELYISESDADFGSPVATGTWAYNSEVKSVVIPEVVGRYLKFVALSEGAGNPWAAAAEINIGVAN